MQIMEILEGLYFIERGYLNGNHFVFPGEHATLIDTAYADDFAETERLISSLGVHFSQVRHIISTHTHCDHIGGNGIIQQKSGCSIALHTVGKHFMDTRDGWAPWWDYFHQKAEFFRCTHPLQDRDRVSIGPHEFEVLYTPGHAADGIVLYHRDEKILLSSDTLWETDMAVMNMRVEGSRAVFIMNESLERIESLEVDIVYPGHGRPFKDFHGALARAKKRIQGYMGDRSKIGKDLLKKITVYTLLMKRKIPEETFFDLLMATRWFPETVDLYFSGQYREKYDEIMKDFLARGIVKYRNGDLSTTVKS